MDEDIAHELQGTGIGLSIADQCRLLDISRSGYYRWKAQQDKDARQERQRQLDAKKESELAFASAVLDAWEAHPTYGYRKMSHYMMRNGHPEATEKRVLLKLHIEKNLKIIENHWRLSVINYVIKDCQEFCFPLFSSQFK